MASNGAEKNCVMDIKWAFLVPWCEVFAECKAISEVVDTSKAPVTASLRCWQPLPPPPARESLAGRCMIPVPFWAETGSRYDRKRLQRAREAVELFNMLAMFVTVVDSIEELFTDDLKFVKPIWECVLVGKLSKFDPVATQAKVTWGQLLGCQNNPMQYSDEFRAAMGKLEAMRRQLENGNKSKISRRLGKLFDAEVPRVVQLCAVSEEAADVVEKLEGSRSCVGSGAISNVEFSSPDIPLLTKAVARSNYSSLRLGLDEKSKGAAAMHSAVQCLGDSGVRVSGVCSALAEAKSIHKLTLQIGTLWDDNDGMNQPGVQISWVADAAYGAIKENYPPGIIGQAGQDELPLSSSYDSASMGKQADLVVPGYGLCMVAIDDGVNEFIQDPPGVNEFIQDPPAPKSGWKSSGKVEDDEVLYEIFDGMGAGLRTLTMEMHWSDKHPCVLFYRMVLSCPKLEELHLKGFDIALTDMEEKRNDMEEEEEDISEWGVKKLVLEDVRDVDGLLETLSDPNVRMARELVELRLTLTNDSMVSPEYIAALESQDGKFLPVVKQKLPTRSKLAMISVAKSDDDAEDKNKATHQLDESILSTGNPHSLVQHRRGGQTNHHKSSEHPRENGGATSSNASDTEAEERAPSFASKLNVFLGAKSGVNTKLGGIFKDRTMHASDTSMCKMEQEIQPLVCNESDSLVLAPNYHCRYDSASTQKQAEVVVPGYGLSSGNAYSNTIHRFSKSRSEETYP
ncbi:hypothetical protein PHYSODRAFT_334885 [Phytophthora sojae]|uniref:Uncharacterized protein n=1 Tax=Phytophthora sojae (strain P6497) TaxID=1094619 RepID=G4ZSY8_PHYSP|nr:hypothetical protein PHYSODRAFT_334885 [Phytophthora sojae]EGZ13073.1 hypothetical protein PHYSODRAFT_334885 [Phytophthora sojae]|eukprot:XP_009530502.1 hypothetical protein PHYSODRAFT_334885 [Phytophthora sojae]